MWALQIVTVFNIYPVSIPTIPNISHKMTHSTETPQTPHTQSSALFWNFESPLLTRTTTENTPLRTQVFQ